MLILYVHAHMHVGTRVDTSVWLAPTCEWVYTRGKRGEKERSQRSGGRSIVIPTNPSFQHARSRRIHSDNDDNDDNGDNDEYDERSGVPSLSLFSPSPHLPSWLIQWSSREAALVDSCSLFPCLFVRRSPPCVWLAASRSKIILDRSLLSKTGGSSFVRFEGRLYLAEIFFFERERKREGDMIDPGIFRQRVERSFGRSGTSIGAVSVGGAGISRYADDGWI